MLAILGTICGGVFRLLPEVMKWVDRKDERRHELALFDRQLEADKWKAEAANKQIELENEGKLGIAEIQALVEATKAQGNKSGIAWVDAINSLVRPTITFWWVIVMYTGALVAQFLALMHAGAPSIDAILQIWGEDEKAIVSSIIAFWFVDRSLRRGAGVK